jgi:hypothetical protein
VRAGYPTAYFAADDAAVMLWQWQTGLSIITKHADQPVRTLFDRLVEIG